MDNGPWALVHGPLHHFLFEWGKSITNKIRIYIGETLKAWQVLKTDGHAFNAGTSDITVGDQITLGVSGDYVSSKGVDWNACPPGDEFCQHASFIEGGFPISADYGGLMISPSNTLIYSGSIDDDWVNGMLAWRIISED